MDAVLIIFMLGLLLVHCLEQEVVNTYLTNNDAKMVKVSDVDHYFSLRYDEFHNQIIVGAKDHLLLFDLGLNLKQKVEVPAPDDSVKNCILSHPADECHNFIKVMHLVRNVSSYESDVLICGTSAYDPMCSWWEAGNTITASAELDGHDSCPSDPHAPSTSWFNAGPSMRLLFVGSSFGNEIGQGTIRVTRMAFGRTTFRTRIVQGPSLLQNAEFVGSFTSKKFLFIAFRENALEDPSNEVTSRIARVCSNGDWWLHQKDNSTGLLSFTKARIECGGYTIVQGISFVEKAGLDPLFIATFQSPSLEGSVICAYRLSEAETAFSGNFWCPSSSEPATWDECEARPTGYHQGHILQTCYGKRDSRDVEDRILMKKIISPICGGPIYSTKSSGLSHLDVQPASGGFRAVIVGDDRDIWKFTIQDCNMSLKQILRVIPATERYESINFLVQLFDELYVVTNRGITRIPQKNISSTMTQKTSPILTSTRSKSSLSISDSRMLQRSSTVYPQQFIHPPHRRLIIRPNLATMTRRSSVLSMLLMLCVTINILVR